MDRYASDIQIFPGGSYGNAKAPKSRYYKILNGDERAMIPVLIDSPHTRTLLDEL